MKRFSILCRSLALLTLSAALCMLAGCGKQSYAPPVLQPKPSASAGSGAAIAASAKSQVGRPYVSGGTTPARGFDCSGLVYWACLQNGISVPRVSREQAGAGKSIPKKSLLPGDIVVFRIPRTGYHTGIYVGQNSFVHSPRPKSRVRIESLSLDYWNKYYVTARRVAFR